jgi:hypothetical protein
MTTGPSDDAGAQIADRRWFQETVSPGLIDAGVTSRTPLTNGLPNRSARIVHDVTLLNGVHALILGVDGMLPSLRSRARSVRDCCSPVSARIAIS